MKNRTRQHYIMSSGMSPGGLAFVSWDSGEDPYQRASDDLLDGDTPAERCKGPQRKWAQAAKHLTKVWSRFVQLPLWRPAAKPVASV